MFLVCPCFKINIVYKIAWMEHREAARGYLNQATEVAANFTPAKE